MTVYKVIVTLKNGSHRIMRATKDIVAHIVTEFRKMQHNIFNDVVCVVVNGTVLVLNDCENMKFINEYTREEFLAIS